MRTLLLISSCILFAITVKAQALDLQNTVWNIEHISSNGDAVLKRLDYEKNKKTPPDHSVVFERLDKQQNGKYATTFNCFGENGAYTFIGKNTLELTPMDAVACGDAKIPESLGGRYEYSLKGNKLLLKLSMGMKMSTVEAASTFDSGEEYAEEAGEVPGEGANATMDTSDYLVDMAAEESSVEVATEQLVNSKGKSGQSKRAIQSAKEVARDAKAAADEAAEVYNSIESEGQYDVIFMKEQIGKGVQLEIYIEDFNVVSPGYNFKGMYRETGTSWKILEAQGPNTENNLVFHGADNVLVELEAKGGMFLARYRSDKFKKDIIIKQIVNLKKDYSAYHLNLKSLH